MVILSNNAVIKAQKMTLHEESPTRQLTLILPPDLDFADLEMRHGEGGEVLLNVAPIIAICDASGLPASVFLCSEGKESLAKLILSWYTLHLARGGKRDPVQEECMSDYHTGHWGERQFTYAAGHA